MSPRSISSVDRQPRPERGVDGLLVEADLGQLQPLSCTRGSPCGAASSPRSGSRTGCAGRRRARSRRRRRGACPRTRPRRGRTGTALGDHARRSGRTPRGSGARARRGGGPTSVGVSRVTSAIIEPLVPHGDALHPGPLLRRRARSRRPSSDLALPPGAASRAGARPRRRRCRPCRPGTASGRWSGAPGRARRSGAPPRPRSGASSRRSEKQRSASGCHDATSRCTWASASPRSAVFVRAPSSPRAMVHGERCVPVLQPREQVLADRARPATS